MLNVRNWLETVLTSGSSDNRRPVLGRGFSSNLKGLHVIGDLAGAPVIKLAMAQGVEVIDHLASLPEMRTRPSGDVLDVLVVGAGASGLNAALAAQDRGWRAIVVEKEKIANTIENFPEGKWIYAEPDSKPAKGKLWLDGAKKEDLVARWNQIIQENNLDVRNEEPLTELEKQDDGTFRATTAKQTYRARKIILATGQRGNPRKLGVPGEDLEEVYHQLYSPRKYHDEDIVVVGGGNSAVEAALTLAERNRVRLLHRGSEFTRIFKDNRHKLDDAIAAGKVVVELQANVRSFTAGEMSFAVDKDGQEEEKTAPMDHAFVLVGAELPVRFLKSLGVRLENDWEGGSLIRSTLLTALTFAGLWFLGSATGGAVPFGGALDWMTPTLGALVAALAAGALVVTGTRGDRWSWLGLSFLIWYSIYGIKMGVGEEFWPYRGWGYALLSFFDRPWSFWYTVLYSVLMTGFGLAALKRWGLEKRDKVQILRFSSLLAFQWFFFFIVPEFLFQWAVRYQWVGQELASNPQFADQAWRSYGIVYAWPLFFYTWLYDPHQIWVIWGIFLTFVVIPIFVLFNGKRYCSWVCGCGGLAETFGDRWRHLAPKGKAAVRWERMGLLVLAFATAVTFAMLCRDVYGLVKTADWGMYLYRIGVDVWLVGILPVTLYPFLGGKVWCRYWCPLAKMMQVSSHFFTRFGWSRFHIVANDKCIACNECSRNCQVGIDVMQYALKQEPLDNATSSCIGCGICVTVCPMDTLSYSSDGSLPTQDPVS